MPHIDEFQNLTWSLSWGDRPETPEQCAARALKCMKAIRETFSGFETWLQVNKEKWGPVAMTRRALTERFAKGQNFGDLYHQPIVQLGYTVSLLSSELSLGYVNPYFSFGCWGGNWNGVNLETYLTAKAARRIFTLKKCVALTEQLVEACRPDSGTVRNFALYKLTKDFNAAWIVYLSRDLSRHLPELPAGVEINSFKRLATILVAADRTFPKTPPKNLKLLKKLGPIVEPIVELARK